MKTLHLSLILIAGMLSFSTANARQIVMNNVDATKSHIGLKRLIKQYRPNINLQKFKLQSVEITAVDARGVGAELSINGHFETQSRFYNTGRRVGILANLANEFIAETFDRALRRNGDSRRADRGRVRDRDRRHRPRPRPRPRPRNFEAEANLYAERGRQPVGSWRLNFDRRVYITKVVVNIKKRRNSGRGHGGGHNNGGNHGGGHNNGGGHTQPGHLSWVNLGAVQAFAGNQYFHVNRNNVWEIQLRGDVNRTTVTNVWGYTMNNAKVLLNNYFSSNTQSPAYLPQHLPQGGILKASIPSPYNNMSKIEIQVSSTNSSQYSVSAGMR